MTKKNYVREALLCTGAFLMLLGTSIAADKVVVVPLGGTVGNATASDVLKGKTFSSKTAGKGTAGTLEIRDGSTIYTNSVGMKFSLIPAGSFIMGSPDSNANNANAYPRQPAEPGRDSNEKQHQVTISKSFYMQTTEVTQGQWLAVMGGTNPSYFDSCGMDCPVEQVSWNDAQEFIHQLNINEGRLVVIGAHELCLLGNCYSLPTESQWEYAARGGTVTAFYNGDITQPSGNDPRLNEIGWYLQNSGSTTHPVAQKAPNNWGLYDMSGNVWEWCEDLWGTGTYPDGPVTDPAGGTTGSYRVLRGGSWYFNAGFARSADRGGNAPGYRSINLGFRLALPSGQ